MSSKRDKWTDHSLGDLIDLQAGFAFKSAEFSDDPGDIRLLRGDNVVQGGVRWSGAKRWPRGPKEGLSRYELCEGDVVLAMDRPWIPAGLKYAVISTSDLPALLVQRVARLRASNGLLTQEYLSYIIGSPDFTRHVLSVQTGTAVPHISGRQIADYEVRAPPVSEQRRIAEVLSAIDDKIESNKRTAALAQKTAATVYRGWFVDGVAGPGASSETEEGRALRNVRDVATITYGAPFKSALFGADGVHLLRIRDLGKDEPGVRTSETRAGARLIEPGDLVVGMDGEFRAHPWHGPPSWLNQRVCVFDPLPDVSRVFVLEAIKMPLAFFEATKGGTTVIHLGKMDIDTFEVPVTDADTMAAFAKAADPLLGVAVGLRLEARHLTQVREALLPKLVTGKLRISDAQDLPELVGSVEAEIAVG